MHCHWLTAGLLVVYAIELHPLSPSFGLEVRGITREDLRSKEAHKTLRDAFSASRGLLLLRGLHGLSCDELITLSSVFGDVEAAPADGSYESLVDDAGRVHEFATVPSSGVFQGEACTGDWQYDAATGKPSWHTDQSFRSPRPLASAMYCLETPGDGVGQTVFCSTVAACEDLPARVRTRLEKLRAAHSYEQLSASFQRFAGGTAKTLSAARKKTLVEPALYHLVDDGALYLAPHAISGVVDETGKAIAGSELVDALARHCTRPAYVHAHAWAPGDYVRTGARIKFHFVCSMAPSFHAIDATMEADARVDVHTGRVEQSADDARRDGRTRVRGEAAHVAHDCATARRRQRRRGCDGHRDGVGGARRRDRRARAERIRQAPGLGGRGRVRCR